MKCSSKNTVLFLVENISWIGGIEAITLSVGKRLSSFYNVYVISLVKPNSRIFERGESSIRFLALPFKSRIGKLMALWWLGIKTKARHIIIQGRYLYSFCFLSHLLPYTKVYFYDHDSFRAYSDNQANEYLPRKRAVRHADKVVVLTADNCEEYKRRLEVPDSKLFVIPNFVEYSPSSFKYDSLSKTIISLGRLDRQKRYDLLISAFANVAGQIPDWKLVIYGDGPERNALSSLIYELRMGARIELMGWCEKPSRVYANASFFVMSSEHEGFGMALLEALCHNLPVIAFDCPSGPSDIVQDGRNGILVKNGDIEGLGKAIKRLAKERELRINFSNNAKISAQKYSPAAIIDRWLLMFGDGFHHQGR